ncbi:MAG: metal-dependent transcriptional regulator [Bacillota bacterium]
MKPTRTTENYLETILILMNRNGSVRSIDVANELGYSRPTVSVAMKNFREKGYLTIDDCGLIKLTAEGLRIAETIYERHVVLSNILMSLGVSEETALADACRLEHDISQESFECMKKHYEARIKSR